MLRRPHLAALGLVLLLALILLNLPTQTSAQLKLALGGLFLPLFGLAGSTHNLLDRTIASFAPKTILVSELERLRIENEKLRVISHQNQQLLNENAQLRGALQWQKKAPWNLQLARVVVRDPANWWRTIQIDRGSRDGVVTNMPVLTAEGLVGRVQEVGINYSRVALVGDPNCRVAVTVEETRDAGVVTDSSPGILEQALVELTYLPRHSQVKPGHKVATSGMGGIFPKGIPVGQVVDVRNVGFGLYLDARVKLAANIQELNHVWVLFPPRDKVSTHIRDGRGAISGSVVNKQVRNESETNS